MILGLASDDLFHVLLDRGLHSTSAGAIDPKTGVKFPFTMFVGKEPADEEDTVSLFDAGNGSQNPKFALESSIVQVKSRTKEYNNGNEYLESIRRVLEGSPPIVVRRSIAKPTTFEILPPGQPYVASAMHNDTRIIGVYVQSAPTFVGRDERDRQIWTMHLLLEREPMGSGSGFRTTIGSHSTT